MLEGNCPELTVEGDGNIIQGSCKYGHITVKGHGNLVYWSAKANKKAPVVSKSGMGNNIYRQ
jgi:hypothetical protein